MTIHGAYTKAFHAAHEMKDLAADTQQKIKGMNAAYPLPNDPALVEELNAIAKALRDATVRLSKIRERTFATTKKYLDANHHRITKGFKLTRNHETYEFIP